ncbi:MAG TPA: hypothetical protein VGI39_28710 [Polyangiaceae bacterium]
MIRSPRAAVILVLALGAAACSKEETKETAAVDAAKPAASALASAIPSAAPSASAAPAATLTQAESLPGPDKADRKARRQISHANYKTELDKMDKEIGNP